jgi:hypothetical protein
MPNMGMSRMGLLEVKEHFLHFEDNIAATGLATGVVWGTGYVSVGEVGFVSVNEGSLAWTIDEPGGILAITTDTGDNDNACLIAGAFRPTDGGVESEYRFKHNTTGTVQLAIYAGFSETMAFDAPVMPAEFATATMTYNGAGGMVGASLDPDGTTDDWRAIQADGGAGGTGSSTTGVAAGETITADEYYIVRTEIDVSGTSRVYVGHQGGATGTMKLVGDFTTAGITPGDQQYAVLMCENRSAAAKVMEVDYFYARGHIDWTV